MNRPIFNEEDIQTIFGVGKEKPTTPPPAEEVEEPVKVEFKPEPPQPPAPEIKKFWEPHEKYQTALKVKKPLAVPKLILRFISLFVLIFAISYTIINSPALILKFKYFWANDYRDSPWQSNFVVPKPEQINKNESFLFIPKIRVSVPIIWNVEEQSILEQLQNGVVHYKGTALPGQQGNIFITGHSSYYLWSSGSYKDVFALLDKLSAGDKIYLQYEGAIFTYEVTQSIVIEPDDLSVLRQTNEKTLSLMTCVPIGTNLRRLVVSAKQVAG